MTSVVCNTPIVCSEDPVLSLRLSCDRCRIQKLKCCVPSGSSTCQRCSRARVQCVFGRRARSKRSQSDATNKKDDRGGVQLPLPPPTKPSSLTADQVPPPAHEPTPKNAATAYPTPSLDLSRKSTFQSSRDISMSCQGFDDMDGNIQASWDELSAGLSEISQTVDCDGEMAEYAWMQSEISMDGEGNYHQTPVDAALWMHRTPLSIPAAVERPFPALASSNRVRSSVAQRDASVADQQLTTLVVDMQLQLSTLEKGPWQSNGASIEEYPVGEILRLSQRFGAIAGPTLLDAAPGRGSSDMSTNDSESTASGPDTSNTATILLVMCGYMYLVHIYDIALGHFKQHLTCMPINAYAGSAHNMLRSPCSEQTVTSTTSTISSTSAMRLGELPCTDLALGLQQIHTAVRMLISALDDVERQLGRGAAEARDAAVTLLMNTSRGQDGSATDLGKKVYEIKGLLREQMGL